MVTRKLSLFLVIILSASFYFFIMFFQYIMSISSLLSYADLRPLIQFDKQKNWSKEIIITNLSSFIESHNATTCRNPQVRCDNCINPIIKC
jgi:hypothetical protein